MPEDGDMVAPPVDEEPVKSAELSFDVDASAFFRQIRPKSADGQSFKALFSGNMQVTNIDDASSQDFAWSIDVDTAALTATSNRTIILAPGTYDFALLVSAGDQQYIGSASAVTVGEGAADIAMTIQPVLGDPLADISVVAQTPEFSFNYDPGQLGGLGDPQLGVTIDGGDQTVLAFDADGVSQSRVNLSEGAHTIELELLDGSVLVARSRDEQENVTITAGVDLAMDLVALQADTNFSLDIGSSQATFNLAIPQVVVDEAGGLANLQVQLTTSDTVNGDKQADMALSDDGAGSFSAEATLDAMQFADGNSTLTFFDTSVTPAEQIASCSQAYTLSSEDGTTPCEIDLLRRSVIGGDLKATIGVSVFNPDGSPAAGATVDSGDGNPSVADSNGFVRLFLAPGDHTLSAQSADASTSGDASFSAAALDIQNVTIQLAVP